MIRKAIAAIGLFFGMQSAAGAVPIFPDPVVPIGVRANRSAWPADLDGDGLLDIVVTGRLAGGSARLAFIMGQGDGTFGDPVFWDDPDAAFGLETVVDLNHDGSLDIVTVTESGGTIPGGQVRLHLNRGDGTFESPVVLPSPMSAGMVVSGDFDGDGGSDLLLKGRLPGGAHALQAYMDRGDGTWFVGFPFSPRPIQSPEPVYSMYGRLQIADLDRDGRDDLVYAENHDYPGGNAFVQVFISHGGGEFVRAQEIVISFDRDSRAFVTDLDGDALPDLVLKTSSRHQVHLGLGTGQFSPAPVWTFPGGWGDVRFAHLDGDGVPDLLITSSPPSAWRGAGDGTFQPLGSLPLQNVDMAPADFDRDGQDDVALTYISGAAVYPFRGNGDGTFGRPPLFEPFTIRPDGMLTADFDADGDDDLVLARYDGSQVEVQLGQGDGTLSEPVAYPCGVTPSALASGDFDGDGDRDLAVAATGETISLLLGSGDGTFQPGPVLDTWYTGRPLSLVAEDLDRDGILELISVNECHPVAQVCSAGETSEIWVHHGRGDGTFDEAQRLQAGPRPVDVTVADVDRDGWPDLVVATAAQGHPSAGGVPGDLSLLRGTGGGAFGSPQVVLTGINAASVVVADFDRDGWSDVAVADRGWSGTIIDGSVRVLRGEPDGTLQPIATLTGGSAPFLLRALDLDGDALTDIAATYALNGAYASSEVGVHLGLAGGGFAPAQRFGLMGMPISFTGATLVAGGFPDLLVFGPMGLDRLANRTPVPPLLSRLAIAGFGPLGRRPARLVWETTRETDLAGFNVLLEERNGSRTVANGALIACFECSTGRGANYAFTLPRVGPGQRPYVAVYLEVVRVSGATEVIGPVLPPPVTAPQGPRSDFPPVHW